MTTNGDACMADSASATFIYVLISNHRSVWYDNFIFNANIL